jgi:hypothetical protein
VDLGLASSAAGAAGAASGLVVDDGLEGYGGIVASSAPSGILGGGLGLAGAVAVTVAFVALLAGPLELVASCDGAGSSPSAVISGTARPVALASAVPCASSVASSLSLGLAVAGVSRPGSAGASSGLSSVPLHLSGSASAVSVLVADLSGVGLPVACVAAAACSSAVAAAAGLRLAFVGLSGGSSSPSAVSVDLGLGLAAAAAGSAIAGAVVLSVALAGVCDGSASWVGSPDCPMRVDSLSFGSSDGCASLPAADLRTVLQLFAHCGADNWQRPQLAGVALGVSFAYSSLQISGVPDVALST